MTQQEVDRLIEVIRSMSEGAKAKQQVAKEVLFGKATAPQAANGSGQPVNIATALRDPDTLEWLYRQFRNRMIDDLKSDPIFVQLLANQSEIVVEFHPQIVTLDGSTLKGRLARLIAQGFFDGAKRTGEARGELARTGSDPNSGQLSDTLGQFVRDGVLTREGDRYKRAAGLKVSEKRIETP